MLAGTTVLACVVVSCKNTLSKAERLDLSKTPMQSVSDMFVVQTKNGIISMRMEAPILQKFQTDSSTYDLFSEGLSVFAYNEKGLLETVLVTDQAKHETKNSDRGELWMAFGNVVIHNVINKETVETDTLYWDQKKKEIYTDCYVKMYSPSGFMQGYGMRSDDHARNAILHRPFNSFGVTVQDTTQVIIDSVNFIGPFMRK